jgi:hypothetical protein
MVVSLVDHVEKPVTSRNGSVCDVQYSERHRYPGPMSSQQLTSRSGKAAGAAGAAGVVIGLLGATGCGTESFSPHAIVAATLTIKESNRAPRIMVVPLSAVEQGMCLAMLR